MKKIFSRVISAVLTAAVMAGAVPTIPCFSFSASADVGDEQIDYLSEDFLSSFSTEFSVDLVSGGEIFEINGVLHLNEIICLDVEYDNDGNVSGFRKTPLQLLFDGISEGYSGDSDKYATFIENHDFFVIPKYYMNYSYGSLVFRNKDYDFGVVVNSSYIYSVNVVSENNQVQVLSRCENYLEYSVSFQTVNLDTGYTERQIGAQRH